MSAVRAIVGEAAPVGDVPTPVRSPVPHDSAHRLVAFSDAVFAVIITILVLDLRPPAGTGYSALFKLWPTAVSYAISYLFIAIVWLNHHHLMRHAPAVSTNLVWANFTHLFSVSLVPFATSWVADSRLAGAPLSLYAVIFAVANASYLVLCWEVMDRPMLGDAEIRKFMRMRAWTTLGLFGAAAVLALLSPIASVVVIVFCLTLYLRPETRSPAGALRRRIRPHSTSHNPIRDTREQTDMSTEVTLVLVHGAWADGSSWARVIDEVEAAGVRAVAAPLPLSSFADDVAALESTLEHVGGPVVLAGHAYAGGVIAATTAENVRALVYVAALAPVEGESVAEIFGRGTPHPQAPALAPDTHGLIWLPDEAFAGAFAHRATQAEQTRLRAVQRPISITCITAPVGRPRWQDLPTWYLIAEQDRMISSDNQHFMAERMGAAVRSHPVDHMLLLTAPDVVTEVLLEAVRTVEKDLAQG